MMEYHEGTDFQQQRPVQREAESLILDSPELPENFFAP
jgi:hypothetical protein